MKNSNVEKRRLARPRKTRDEGQKLVQKALEQKGEGELREKLVQALELPMSVLVGKEAEEQEEEAQIPQEGAAVLVEVCVEGVEAYHDGFSISFLMSSLGPTPSGKLP